MRLVDHLHVPTTKQKQKNKDKNQTEIAKGRLKPRLILFFLTYILIMIFNESFTDFV